MMSSKVCPSMRSWNLLLMSVWNMLDKEETFFFFDSMNDYYEENVLLEEEFLFAFYIEDGMFVEDGKNNA